jgi:murein DD-endopeptidase MepM/ murein hydrolase activator NlpD
MEKTEFRYNKKTLRYERVSFSFWRTGLAMVAYLLFGFLFFAGLNLLQNFVLETPLEKSLTAENKSLKEYKTVLASQLNEASGSIKGLKDEEKKLYEKLFEAPQEPEPTSVVAAASIASTTDSFDEAYETINAQLSSTKLTALNARYFFANESSVKKSDVSLLANVPSLMPVKSITEEKLVSGFGIRINPFHKSNYHHDGIDIASPVNTEVFATGNGRVSLASQSDTKGGFGNYIEIDHGNGLVSRYAHLEGVKVYAGQKITKGQTIGTIGSTGGSAAPHLHYEILKKGKNINPMFYMVENVSAKDHDALMKKSKRLNQSLD